MELRDTLLNVNDHVLRPGETIEARFTSFPSFKPLRRPRLRGHVAVPRPNRDPLISQAVKPTPPSPGRYPDRLITHIGSTGIRCGNSYWTGENELLELPSFQLREETNNRKADVARVSEHLNSRDLTGNGTHFELLSVTTSATAIRHVVG